MVVGNKEKIEQLERVLQSQTFQGSESLRAFLRFVVLKAVENQDHLLKEYTIATEVFGRKTNYDSRIDSVVRVQAGRLRAKLHEYYSGEGSQDKIIIELPKGHYSPAFSVAPEDNGSGGQLDDPKLAEALFPVARDAGAAESPVHSREKVWLGSLIAAVVVLVLAVGILAVSNWDLRQQVQDSNPANPAGVFGPVWEPFLKQGNNSMLVLSNPPVYRFTNNVDPEVLARRSIELNPEQASALTEDLGDRFLTKHNRNPRIVLTTENYTGMGEAIGLHHVTNLFRSAGKNVLLKQSRTISPEDLKNHNVILLGSVWVNEWSGKLKVNEDFIYTGDATIRNNNPLEGEELEYIPKFDERTGRLVEDYALITVKPNITESDMIMVLAGIHSEGTQAAAEYVTNPVYLNELNQRLYRADNSEPIRHYQALLRVLVDNGIPTRVSLLAVHETRMN